MARSGNSAKRTAREAEEQEHRRQALELRKQGFTYEQIGVALEMSTSGAHKLVQTALAAIPREAAEDVRDLEIARLDKMLESIWKDVEKGNPKAIGAVVRIMERRAAYLGLAAPIQVEVTAPPAELARMTIEELYALDAEITKRHACVKARIAELAKAEKGRGAS